MPTEDIEPIVKLTAKLVVDELRPILMDYLRSIANPPRNLTPKQKAERRVANRLEADRAGRESCEIFRAERFLFDNPSVWAQLTRTHEQYKAFCYHRNLEPLGRTKFDKWLVGQGYRPTKPDGLKFFVGFRVRNDPEIDPEIEFEPDVPAPQTIDPDFWKISRAARRAGMNPQKVHEMIALKVARTFDVGKKYPLVSITDVLDNMAKFKPRPPAFKVVGSFELYMVERTENVRGSTLDCRAAYADYQLWCESREEHPIAFMRFRGAVGANHQVGPHHGKPMSFWNLAFKSEDT